MGDQFMDVLTVTGGVAPKDILDSMYFMLKSGQENPAQSLLLLDVVRDLEAPPHSIDLDILKLALTYRNLEIQQRKNTGQKQIYKK